MRKLWGMSGFKWRLSNSYRAGRESINWPRKLKTSELDINRNIAKLDHKLMTRRRDICSITLFFQSSDL
jgi:hypothetical protein